MFMIGRLVMNRLQKDQKELLEEIAFKTWNFFIDVTNEKTSFLPPDNIQRGKIFELSPYTSVTNVGFYLTSILTAYKLGFVSLTECIQRIQKTHETLTKLEKHRGLFYSYYDLYSLKPSKPYFVPSVDNSNFLACILVLAEGLRQIADWHQFNNSLFHGIGVIMRLCRQDSHALNSHSILKIDEIEKTIDVPISGISQINTILERIEYLYSEISVDHLDSSHPLRTTLFRLGRHIGDIKNELNSWFPVIPTSLYEEIRNVELEEILGDIPRSETLAILQFRLKKALNLATQEQNVPLAQIIQKSCERLERYTGALDALTQQLDQYASEMDFSFFFNHKLKFMSVGFKFTRKRLEPYHYETLMSESRLLVYLALCKNDIPKKAWSTLTRKLKKGKNGTYILSWGGSNFEYFMPTLFMKYSKASIYQQTFDAYLRDQIEYCEKLDIPWGISESMYDEFNNGGKYKYKAFGFPQAALNPNVDKRRIISPYSTVISLHHDTKHGLENIKRLINDGCYGEYGFYESIDYSSDESGSVVYAYMAHHQGMIMAALCNVLCSNLIVKLFHTNKIVKTGEYLLEENKAGPVPPKQIILKNIKNIEYSH